jgi:F-type H+-transporting ATPase subunit gamma
MTRRQEVEQHRHSLEEIRGIMNSMKTLAYMETRKLARFLNTQQTVVQSIEDTAADLLNFHPDILPTVKHSRHVYLLLGTERGFCGDFNHALLQQLETTLQAHAVDNPLLITIGRKLHILLEDDNRLTTSINGASVMEEITDLPGKIVTELMTLQARHGNLTLYCLYHNDQADIIVKELLPPFQKLMNRPSPCTIPAILNLSPKQMLAELTEHYLFAALHEMLYTSLSAENYRRVTHLEGAVRHLDEASDKLKRKYNTLRQEEIIEEIEVILLSTSNIDKPVLKRKSADTGNGNTVITGSPG